MATSIVAKGPTGPGKRVRLEHDERRASILATAQRLFCERPYAQVSMVDIATEAGVARGLLNHYFGAKRELYLDVIRAMVEVPALPLPDCTTDLPAAVVWERSVDGWMELIEANHEVWLTAIGAGGTGRDPELEEILNDARELVATRVLEALRLNDGPVRPELRALVRGFGGMAEEVTREWLARRRLSRAQARALLLAALPVLVERVLPAMLDAAEGGQGGSDA